MLMDMLGASSKSRHQSNSITVRLFSNFVEVSIVFNRFQPGIKLSVISYYSRSISRKSI